MKITLLNKKGNNLSFLLEGANPAYANALRRMAIEEVPTMAIEIVEFRKNSSALFDEVVALRLGLLPLKTDLKSYNLPNECTCGGGGLRALPAHPHSCRKGTEKRRRGPRRGYKKQ